MGDRLAQRAGLQIGWMRLNSHYLLVLVVAPSFVETNCFEVKHNSREADFAVVVVRM